MGPSAKPYQRCPAAKPQATSELVANPKGGLDGQKLTRQGLNWGPWP